MNSRRVEQVVSGQETQDGAGVKLTRVLTQDFQQRLDPFLMLDVFRSDQASDYLAGFPEHPHRGFETVTYMLAGRMRHRDSRGNEGVLGPGDVQWMTAGRGILHEEMPEQQDGLMEGFQLWINLPAVTKMQEPAYREIPTAQVPEMQLEDGTLVRLLAGSAALGLAGHEQIAGYGAVQRPDTKPLFVDVHLAANADLIVALPASHRAFVFVYRGAATVGGDTAVPAGYMGILTTDADADHVRLTAAAESTKVLLLAGAPLSEPVAQYGPFVMNTRDELIQAVEDFQNGILGRD